MTRPLIVATSHAMDLLTFLLVLGAVGIGGESNPTMRTVYLSAGLLGLVALKVAGTAALSLLAAYRRWALVPAAAAGLFGAYVNTIAFAVR